MPVMNHFLLVEDNESDAMLLRRCFIRSHVTNVVETVYSGEAAIEYLSGTGGYAAAKPQPKGLNKLSGLKELNGEKAPGISSLAADNLGYGSEKRPEFTLPSIIFLDLQLPGMGGFEVLKWIRARPELASTRVVVLTGSDNMQDVSAAYELGANSFLLKPLAFERFTEFSQALGGCWSWCDSKVQSPRSKVQGLKSKV